VHVDDYFLDKKNGKFVSYGVVIIMENFLAHSGDLGLSRHGRIRASWEL